MDLVFTSEDVVDVKTDILYLLDLHYEELCARKDVIKLAPNFDQYQALEDAGKLMVYTARDAGQLVGYSVWFIDCHIHYQHQLFANNDIIFLHPSYRNKTTAWTVTRSYLRRLFGLKKKTKGVGEQLIDYSETQLRLIGVTKAIWHVKFKLNWSPILFRRGYSREDFTMSKIL